MKKRIMTISMILLISIMIAGGSMAWLTSSPEEGVSEFKMGTVEVEVVRSGNESVRIQNIGTSQAYVRVRVIPKWSKSNLSVSNVDVNISSGDWEKRDGHYYYKYPLDPDEMTSNLVNSVSIGDLTEEYAGEEFTLKVVAEGFQEFNR